MRLIGYEEETVGEIRLVYVVPSSQHSKVEFRYPACLLQSVESNDSLSGELAICGEVDNTQYRAVTSTNIRTEAILGNFSGVECYG